MRLIDVDALMQIFAGFVRRSNNSDFADIPTWNDAVSLVESAPTIDPVKRGKWKKTNLDHGAFGERPCIFYCSICNQCIAYPVNYCPNCGAKMEETEDA